MQHTFLKHALWTALFVAGGALAHDAAISGADFTHGRGDAQLSAIGRQAVANGEGVVVTAPAYWQARVAAKIRAGAHGKPIAIRFSNGFYENVLVRTETAAPAGAAAKPEARLVAKPVIKPEPRLAAQPKTVAKTQARSKPAPKLVETGVKPELHPLPAIAPPVSAPVRVEQPRVFAPAVMQQPAMQKPVASAPILQAAAPRPAINIVAVPQVSHQPAVVPIPTAAIAPAGLEPASPAASNTADESARQQLQASLNDGRPAMGSLTEAQLQSGDQIYSSGDALAVVRLEGLHRSLYWLQGADLQRVQYSPQGGGRYEVIGGIDPKVPASHRANAHRMIAARAPAAGAAARTRMEQQYNSGQPITSRLSVPQLQLEDRLLVDGESVVVVRREGNSMVRYWLDGSIDLGQAGVQKIDANVYRVAGNNLH